MEDYQLFDQFLHSEITFIARQCFWSQQNSSGFAQKILVYASFSEFSMHFSVSIDLAFPSHVFSGRGRLLQASNLLSVVFSWQAPSVPSYLLLASIRTQLRQECVGLDSLAVDRRLRPGHVPACQGVGESSSLPLQRASNSFLNLQHCWTNSNCSVYNCKSKR